jgi:hypothetical protein
MVCWSIGWHLEEKLLFVCLWILEKKIWILQENIRFTINENILNIWIWVDIRFNVALSPVFLGRLPPNALHYRLILLSSTITRLPPNVSNLFPSNNAQKTIQMDTKLTSHITQHTNANPHIRRVPEEHAWKKNIYYYTTQHDTKLPSHDN